MKDLEQALTDPENQPSQFGTVPHVDSPYLASMKREPLTDELLGRYKECIKDYMASPSLRQAVCHLLRVKEDLDRLRERHAKSEEYIKKMDTVIDDEHVVESCINPLEDLQRAVRKLKVDRDAAQAELNRIKELIQDPTAVRVNLLRGTIKAPHDLVWRYDTDGPWAEMEAKLTAAQAEIARLKMNVGCAREQRSTQFCAEAVLANNRLDWILKHPVEYQALLNRWGVGLVYYKDIDDALAKETRGFKDKSPDA